MRNTRWTLLGSWCVLATLAACAQDVGDIDRTQPGILRKADFQGEWFVRQTITDVPAAASWAFVGLQFDTERIRWEITEDLLIAYRAYPHIPGATDRLAYDDQGNPTRTQVANPTRDSEGLYEQPIAAFRITSHFDVQRSYNASTGEQSNVIVENTSDRPWFERQYFRVNFGSSPVTSIFTYRGADIQTQAVQYLDETWGPDFGLRQSYEGEQLTYFDFTNRHFLDLSFQSCINQLYGLGIGDCAGQLATVRTSFLRVDQREYEPVYFSDQDMDRFGYFRTERITYDREYGATVGGRILLANRHNLWEQVWQRDAAGAIRRDERGRPLAIPFAERTPKPVVFHLSLNFPQEVLDEGTAVVTGENYDRAFRRAVAAAQFGDDSRWTEVPTMFIICHNPVTDTPAWPEDPSLAHHCGEVGERALIGDLRYHFKYWVNNPQLASPLGYGPSAVDPLTGEIISGTAYTYGASVDTYAQFALNLVRFVNGDLSEDDLMTGSYVRDIIEERRNALIDPRPKRLDLDPQLARHATVDAMPFAGLFDMPLVERATDLLEGRALARVQGLQGMAAEGRRDLFPSVARYEERRLQAIRDAGFDEMLIDDEWLAGLGLSPQEGITDEMLEQFRPAEVLARLRQERARQRNPLYHRDCVLHANDFDDSLLSVAARYAGRTDYDKIYQEIRTAIYTAVQIHEIGHAVGLRHNFAGSMDTVNYFDAYWDLRITGMTGPNGETMPLRAPTTIGDFYGYATPTAEQLQGGMREFQYSSIMDYSNGFHTDLQGLGRYDEAAILYAYTAGRDGGANMRPGFVEVFNDIGAEGRRLFTEVERFRAIGYDQIPERFHYLTLLRVMGDGDFALGAARYRNRGVQRADEVDQSRAQGVADRRVEVPYLFCSDEYASSRMYCRRFDRGADPLEQTMDKIQNYRTMHFFDNYRRERYGWQPSSSLQRYAGRYFLDLVDTYQRWLLGVIYGVDDPALENVWTFASAAGLNVISEVLTTPSSGSYRLVNVDDYDPETGALIGQRQELRLSAFGTDPQAHTFIPEGPGRRRNSRYLGERGYYYYQFPESSGHFWTYLAAILSITSASVSVQGQEDLTGFGDTSFLIPPYLVYEDEITRLFNGIMLRDYEAVAPIVRVNSQGRSVVAPRPLITLRLQNGDLLNPETGEVMPPGLTMGRAGGHGGLPLNLSFGFSERLYAMLFGMANFTSNYSMRFPDQIRVFRSGSGESVTAPEGFDTVEVCDTYAVGGGFCYATAFDPRAAELPYNAQVLQRARTLQRRLNNEQPGSQAYNRLLNEFSQTIDELNIVRSMYTVFGRNF